MVTKCIKITKAWSSARGARLSSRTRSGRGRGRGMGSQNTNVAPKETATVRKGKGVGNTTQFRRPRIIGMGVFQPENGFTTFNTGVPSSIILSIGPKIVLRLAIVTRDVGFKTNKWIEVERKSRNHNKKASGD
ncbi:hypothetical protein KY290_000452 [Solanum tuberosum]|uniref:Uncharacterized protein n=1 Tax=Solanum tuberosum TaxID=4113 RepID=A0ABQ7WLE1_SOLTU|nr:hypothetical protein KY289_000497 [Solanum tuberosum]KAH0780854.1 hypothetical protein KY290_000452 [Solanum tuberosum]